MTLSRPVIIALIGAVAAAGLFVYTRSMGPEENIPPAEPSPSKSSGASPGAGSSAAPSTPGSASPSQGKAKTGSPGKANGAGGSGGKTGSKPGSGAGPTPVSVPPPVARAMLQHKVVLVLFWSRGGPEDRVAKQVVDQVRGSMPSSKVAVFEDLHKNVAKYSLIAGDVSRSPSIVVVDRGLRSKVVSGYVDYGSIVHLIREAQGVRPS